MTQMLLWMTIALSWMTVGLACRCAPPTDKDYCRSDIVLRGRPVADYLVQTNEPYPREIRVYTVNVDEIFWSNSSLVGMTTYNLTTASSSAACGAYFELNTPYVIAVHESNGQLSTTSCSGNTNWNSLDKTQKRFFRKRLRSLCA